MMLHRDSRNIRCLIIDDDPFIRDLLKDKIKHFFPEIKLLGYASNGVEGLAMVHSLKPDLLFLDVEMSDMTGFELLSRLKNFQLKTIFITSYKHYAIKAIRYKALDYLLKPIDLEELRGAIERFKNEFRSGSHSYKQYGIRSFGASTEYLRLNTQQGELKLPFPEIILIKGDRNYSKIILTNSRNELVSKTLRWLEEIIDGRDFFRCHKSYIVNKKHIQSLKSHHVEMIENFLIPISRRKRNVFEEWLQTSVV